MGKYIINLEFITQTLIFIFVNNNSAIHLKIHIQLGLAYSTVDLQWQYKLVDLGEALH